MLFNEPIRLPLQQADVIYYQNFFAPSVADKYFEILYKEIPWQQDNITVFGKTYPQPRLTAFFANNNLPYSYSGITMTPHLFSPTLIEIKTAIENIADIEFTSCLANLYRNGQDSNGWHSDNESSLGKHPLIASISLGATRRFALKHKSNKNWKHSIDLKHGSLLIMKGETQEHWLHQIPKTKKVVGSRLNLTLRIIK
ncbi:alpha-ketoglutarate-dependent dioxygenase AlkB family protein [Mangrovimonas aestuarii]|uniref:alpha-ketoglutarate-dependent dioxygenase AlkB family protein n=1 Tax=Mangrovimonas aestuarii TaxID=3018443 RepID=UPI002378EA4E|nr:alpha-ketoglutarate-dependent dioxygenase AlkB [Mangrovimonas aestuarii]